MVSTKDSTIHSFLYWMFFLGTKSRRQKNILLVLGYNTVTGRKWRYLPLASSVSTQTYNTNNLILYFVCVWAVCVCVCVCVCVHTATLHYLRKRKDLFINISF